MGAYMEKQQQENFMIGGRKGYEEHDTDHEF